MGETEEERIKFNKLCDDVEYLVKNVKSINVILRGEKNEPKPTGLIHSVYENTKYRKFTTRVLWLLFATSLTLVLNELLVLI